MALVNLSKAEIDVLIDCICEVRGQLENGVECEDFRKLAEDTGPVEDKLIAAKHQKRAKKT